MRKRELHPRCKHCNEKFRPRRADALFCSDMCKQARYRMNNKKRQETVAFEVRQKRHEEALAAIHQFDQYQSMAAMLHVKAQSRGLKLGFMGTKMGVLAVEGSPGELARGKVDRAFPPWVRPIRTTSDDRELKALLSVTPVRVGGSYIEREAEKECRRLLSGGALGVSIFVDDWDNYIANHKPARAPSDPRAWPCSDFVEVDPDFISEYRIHPGSSMDSDAPQFTEEFFGEGFQIVDPAKQ